MARCHIHRFWQVYVIEADLSLIHGFWSSAKTWEKVCARIQTDSQLSGIRLKAFEYESPKLKLPFSRIRIPDYNDISQAFASEFAARLPGNTDVVIVSHSQGGLILQRFLVWMLHEGRGEELARIRMIVMLSCPNEGSEYLRSLRASLGFRRHPQAGQLDTLNADAADARRIVLKRVVNASGVTPYECFIPIYLYAGRSDGIVTRASAQSGFPNVGVLPGDHSSILDPNVPGNITVPVLKKHILEALGQPRSPGGPDPFTTQPRQPPAALQEKYRVSLTDSQGVQIGDHNTMFLTPGKQPERSEE